MDGFDRLAADTESSATSLFRSAEGLLREARLQGDDALTAAAQRICRAQPSMGAMWNLAAAALAGEDLFERFTSRAHRAPAAATRLAATHLSGEARRIVTCSRSALVEAVIRSLGVPSVVAESRPGFEGRALAASLASESLSVTIVSDAAIGSHLERGDVVLVGADAIAAEWFINKTGTGQLCAAALLAGIPAYVVSGREKCVSHLLAPHLSLRADDPRALWPDAPEGITVNNILFERVPLDRLAGVITDTGVLAGGMIEAACESVVPPPSARWLAGLMQFLPDPGKAG